MTENEQRLLVSLAQMCEQNLSNGKQLDHMFMGAGEGALELLVEYGLVTPEPRGGSWTDAGIKLLEAN